MIPRSPQYASTMRMVRAMVADMQAAGSNAPAAEEADMGTSPDAAGSQAGVTPEPSYPPWLQRTHLLLGDDGLAKLKATRVLVVGLGGVGSFAAEFLARWVPPWCTGEVCSTRGRDASHGWKLAVLFTLQPWSPATN